MNKDVALVLITILVALIFDFLNGFHDSANSIATVVSTRVLSPKLAVVWAATFNFLAAFFLGTAVARSVVTIHESRVTNHDSRVTIHRFSALRPIEDHPQHQIVAEILEAMDHIGGNE